MDGSQARFILETMAVLFEKKKDIMTLLDDISSRLEELEVELEQQIVDSGFNVTNHVYRRGWWDSPAFKPGLDADGACECEKREADSSYRMD